MSDTNESDLIMAARQSLYAPTSMELAAGLLDIGDRLQSQFLELHRLHLFGGPKPEDVERVALDVAGAQRVLQQFSAALRREGSGGWA